MESKAEHVGFGATTVVALLAGRQLSIVLLSVLEYSGEYGRKAGFAYISESIVASMGLIVKVSMVLKVCCREYSGAYSRYRRYRRS